MKRYLGALAVAALVFGVVLGSAAALDIDGGAVQVGQSNVTCDTNGVTVASYKVEASDPGAPQSYGVRVDDISSACEGADLFAKVFGNGQQLGFGRAIVTGGQADVTYEGGSVPARQIERVQLTIDG